MRRRVKGGREGAVGGRNNEREAWRKEERCGKYPEERREVKRKMN